LLFCFVLYFSTIDTFFTGEDFDNIGYQSIDTVIRNFIFKPKDSIGHFTRGIPNTFWAIQYQLFGKDYIYYHIVNIILHWLCSFLVFKFAYKLGENHEEKKLISYAAGFLFAAMPVHAIVVNWLTLLFEKFCTIFVISAFLSWMNFKSSQKRKFYALTLMFFIFGLLSKEEAITFPLIIYIYDKIFHWKKEVGWKNIFDGWKYYLPAFCISLAFIPYRIYRFSGVADMSQHASIGPELFKNFIAIAKMMSHPLWVWSLVIFWVTGLFLKNKIFYFSSVWILVILIPVYHIPTEWRLYLASVGFCIALAANFYDLFLLLPKKRLKTTKVIFNIFIIILTLIYSFDVSKRNQEWKDVTDLSKNLYEKFKRRFPSIPSGQTIYFAGVDDAKDVCTTALFDTIVKFMYEKNITINNFDDFFADIGAYTEDDKDKILFLVYKNGRIYQKDSWKEALFRRKLPQGEKRIQITYDFKKESIQNIKKQNPELSFLIKDGCCQITTKRIPLKIDFKEINLKTSYLNTVIFKMKIPQTISYVGKFFWETKDGEITKTMFFIERSEEFIEYKIYLAEKESWFLYNEISGFSLSLPVRYVEICYIKFTSDHPPRKPKKRKIDSLQPIPEIKNYGSED